MKTNHTNKTKRKMRKDGGDGGGVDRRTYLFEFGRRGVFIAIQVQVGPLWITAFQENVLIKTGKRKDGKRTYTVYVPIRGQIVFQILYIFYQLLPYTGFLGGSLSPFTWDGTA